MSTSSTTAVCFASSLVKLKRYWRNRADGEVTDANCDAGTGSVHLDHPFSPGSLRFPLRVDIFRLVPAGSEPCNCILPKRLTCWASSTGLVYVPSEAKPVVIAAIPPVLARPKRMRPFDAGRRDMMALGSTLARTTVSSADGLI